MIMNSELEGFIRNSHGTIMQRGSNEEINKKSQPGIASGYN
jgi:hypothetical protein